MADLATGFMMSHYQVQHRTGRGPHWEANPYPTDPRLYRVSLPREVGSVGCQVEGYEGQTKMLTNLRIHSVHRHVRKMIVIIEKGNHYHARFIA